MGSRPGRVVAQDGSSLADRRGPESGRDSTPIVRTSVAWSWTCCSRVALFCYTALYRIYHKIWLTHSRPEASPPSATSFDTPRQRQIKLRAWAASAKVRRTRFCATKTSPPPGLRFVGGPKLLKWGLSGRGHLLLPYIKKTYSSKLVKSESPLTCLLPPGV